MHTQQATQRIDEFGWLTAIPVVSIDLQAPEALPLPEVIEPREFTPADEILNRCRAIYLID